MTVEQHQGICEAVKEHLHFQLQVETIGQTLKLAQQRSYEADRKLQASLRSAQVTEKSAIVVRGRAWWLSLIHCQNEKIESVVIATTDTGPARPEDGGW